MAQENAAKPSKSEVQAYQNPILKYLMFIWTMLSRLFKRGVRVRHDDEVKIKALPKAVDAQELHQPQPLRLTADGTGPLYYRHYKVKFKRSGTSVAKLLAPLLADPGIASAPELAVFKKTKGVPGTLKVGDEFFIEITGPWNGPVRTIDVSEKSFSFATVEGHMETGEITFQISALPNEEYAFEIFSWARSRDNTVDLVYDKMKIAKQAQTEMWTLYCEKVVELSGAKQSSDVLVEDKRTEFKFEAIPVKDDNAPWKKYEARLKAIAALKENFDLSQRESYTTENGWRVDKYSCQLVPEKPGAPEPAGSFALGKQVLVNYEFPDPKLITGIFVPDSALDKRIMLLRAKFWFFTFYFGVRIGQVTDEKVNSEAGAAQVWGYNYHTLEGHFERGEINFQIWKYLDSGQVEFKISAFSQPDHIKNIFYRWGFKLFGRRLQLRFAKVSMERMQSIVRTRLNNPYPRA